MVKTILLFYYSFKCVCTCVLAPQTFMHPTLLFVSKDQRTAFGSHSLLSPCGLEGWMGKF